MAATSEKIPIALAGPEDLQQFMPPAYTAVSIKPSNSGRLLKIGVAVLIVGAALLLFGAIGAFYFWNVNDKHVYNVHYSMSINGKVEEGSMEIDPVNNLERFRTGSGSDEAIEVHDFQIGITGIRFAGGEKCFIKTQAKGQLPDVESLNKDSLTFDLEDEIMPAKFEEESLVLVAAGQPLKDSSFLSSKILDLCGDLPIFWLRPTYRSGGQRKKRAPPRNRRPQVVGPEEEEPVVEEEPPFNPENPYHDPCHVSTAPLEHKNPYHMSTAPLEHKNPYHMSTAPLEHKRTLTCGYHPFRTPTTTQQNPDHMSTTPLEHKRTLPHEYHSARTQENPTT
ncbi:hypothetical protein ACEWY4_016933 [Coilia grayii]|uniref:Leukocyte cell-derived chemotaxin 1 n=1 Tax=Coilia grayii TaxID=363190 RepID=A0ABD1JN63_9TELE